MSDQIVVVQDGDNGVNVVTEQSALSIVTVGQAGPPGGLAAADWAQYRVPYMVSLGVVGVGAGLTFDGTTLTATAFSGPLTGDVTGNLTGNVTGNLTGNVTGNLTGNVTGNLTGNVTGNVLGSVSYTTAGIFVTPSITDNGDGTLTLGSGEYVFAGDANGTYPYTKHTIAGAIYSFTDAVNNYIIANYNGGSPIMSVVTTTATINNTTIIPILTVFREGTRVEYLEWDTPSKALPNRLMRRFVRTQRFAAEPGGLALGELATRTITVTAGAVWNGPHRAEFTSFSSATDATYLYAHVAGVWTRSAITQYNNTQYDNGTDLATLTGNKYTVNWVFQSATTGVQHILVVLGTSDYTLNQAIESTVPASLPPEVSSTTILLGRIIVQKNAASAQQINSAFTQTLAMTPANDHNTLANLQGGAADEYYHLTSAEYTGSGTGVFARVDSPSFTTPSLGVASATSINKVALTAPATSATLTIADGKTLTASNTLTLTATDGSTLAIGTGGTLGTAAYTAATAYEAAGAIATHAALQTGVHGISITAAKTLTVSASMTLTAADDTGVYTFPTGTASIARTNDTNTFAGVQTFSGTIVSPAGTVTLPGTIYAAAETGTGFYRIGANDVGFSVSGTHIAGFDSTGFKTQKIITSTLVGNNIINNNSLGTTGGRLAHLGATGTDMYIAVAGSTGGGLITASSAYDMQLRNDTGIGFGIGTAMVGRFGSAGLAITGTLSSTGILSTTDATDAASATVASLKTAGGIAAEKALWIGTTSRLVGAVTMDTSLLVPTIYGSSAANGDITIDGTSSATKTTSYVILQSIGGFVGIGQTSPAGVVHGSSNGALDVIFDRASADANNPGILFRKARGTIASPTVITTGDRLAYFVGRGYSGVTNGYTGGASVVIESEGTISGTAVPGRIIFNTTPAGSMTPAEAMRIASDKAITMQGTLGVTGALTTNGGLQTFLANDSAGAGFRYVVVPNA